MGFLLFRFPWLTLKLVSLFRFGRKQDQSIFLRRRTWIFEKYKSSETKGESLAKCHRLFNLIQLEAATQKIDEMIWNIWLQCRRSRECTFSHHLWSSESNQSPMWKKLFSPTCIHLLQSWCGVGWGVEFERNQKISGHVYLFSVRMSLIYFAE